jgi:DHA1 family tetracycline resistance protein-like MFS transporter
VLDMLALGMILPVLPHLIEDFLGGDTARAARIFGIFGSVWAVMQFVSMPVMGGLSDRFGRRPVILLSNVGLGLDYVLMALAPNLRWLFVGRVISGVTAASISTAMAYIADVTPPENRAKSYGLVGMAFGLGFIIGPALGGVLGSIDPRLPFWAAAAASLANAAYGFFVLPESLPPERRRPFEWKRANPVGSLKFLRAHREITGLAGAAFLSAVAHAVLPAVFVLYAAYRYGWDEKTVGLALAVVGASSMVVQGTLVGPLVRRYGERRVLLAGLLAGAIGFLVYALAPTGPLFLAGIPVVALWGLAAPSAQGLMTRHVAANVQGELQGAMGSLQGIATVIGPIMFATIFSWSIEAGRHWHFPGAAYTLAAMLLAASAAIVATATREGSAA